MARMFMAGPENKNVVAGPIPAPELYIPAKSGRTVQEQTARIDPLTEAIRYAQNFPNDPDRILMTELEEIMLVIPPAIKRAGTRHVRMCNLAYSLSILNASLIASRKNAVFRSIKYASKKTPRNINPIFISFFICYHLLKWSRTHPTHRNMHFMLRE